jgi:DNA polymerase-3 subunit alpha
MDTKEYLSLEKEMLGIYLSGHPLEKFKEKIESLTNINSLDLAEIDTEIAEIGTSKRFKDGQTVKIAGIISKVKKKITRNNSLMAFLSLDDLYGSYEVIVFESIFNRFGINIEEEKIVLIERKTFS